MNDTAGKILIVDDDPGILKVLTMRLDAYGFTTFPAPDYRTALDAAHDNTMDLALVDLRLGKENGVKLMRALQMINPNLPVIILTAHGDIKTAVSAIKEGAFNFISKPFDHKELKKQIDAALKHRRYGEVEATPDKTEDAAAFSGDIVYKSSLMENILQQISRAARVDSPVLILGESGTGKDLVAKRLHNISFRSASPFVAINCAAIPETLFESELFGHAKGAFTGAVNSKRGLLTETGDGTFFVDEITEIPIPVQAKLLRTLEARKFMPLGRTKEERVSARIIAASNTDIQEAVSTGKFREDLFFRISVITIHVPPLRDRKEDISILVRHFLDKSSRQMNKRITGITPEAMHKLARYDWPGNVRELKNEIESAVAMVDGEVIDKHMLLIGKTGMSGKVTSYKNAREEFEKQYVLQLLKTTSGNISRAARLSGKHRSDFYKLTEKYGIDLDLFRG